MVISFFTRRSTMRAKAVGSERTAGANERKREGVRFDAKQWAKLIEAQRRSSLTVVEFCRRRGIAKATFWYWRRRLVSAAKNASGRELAQRFLAVPIVAPTAEHIEVSFDTMRVRLHGAAAARVVDAIVASIGRGAQS
jgi:hypothetical protein